MGGGRVIEYEYPDAAGHSISHTGDAFAAAERFGELGVLKVKRAAAPGPLWALGCLLAVPTTIAKLADPESRKRIDIFDYERDAGLARYDFFRCVTQSSVIEVLKAALETDRLLIMEHNLHWPRLQSPHVPEQMLPLHQDGGLLGQPMVRGWFLVHPDSCGEHAPNIEFVIRDPRHILPIEKQPHSKRYGWLEMDHEQRDQLLASCPRWTPSVDIGDVLLFRGTVPHRTHFPPGASTQRISIEASIYAYSEPMFEYLANNDPIGVLSVSEGRFEHLRRVNI